MPACATGGRFYVQRRGPWSTARWWTAGIFVRQEDAIELWLLITVLVPPGHAVRVLTPSGAVLAHYPVPSAAAAAEGKKRA